MMPQRQTRKIVINKVCLIVVSPLLFMIGAMPGHTTSPTFQIILDGWPPYYQPYTAVVIAETAIQWVNPTATPHSVRHDGCLTDDRCAFDSGAVPPDGSFTLTQLPPGRYPYHCQLHPIMRGELIVIDSVSSVKEKSRVVKP
ncbi:MAG: hypothetical protein C4293_07015 [Nitrospiraceae bacterium]